MTDFKKETETFQMLVLAKDNQSALAKLSDLKKIMLELDSLPPMMEDTVNCVEERALAKQVLEYAVLLSINLADKEAFQRHISSLRPYYLTEASRQNPSDVMYSVIGLNLLYLLVENRLADFHCELELLNEAALERPEITFCTQLDKHLVIGQYDQVLVAAASPPVPYYTFFLTSLLETVRINIGECVSTSYASLTVDAATKMLMFQKKEDTLLFIQDYYPSWVLEGDKINLVDAPAARSNEVPSLKLITQTLSYATELERIV